MVKMMGLSQTHTQQLTPDLWVCLPVHLCLLRCDIIGNYRASTIYCHPEFMPWLWGSLSLPRQKIFIRTSDRLIWQWRWEKPFVFKLPVRAGTGCCTEQGCAAVYYYDMNVSHNFPGYTQGALDPSWRSSLSITVYSNSHSPQKKIWKGQPLYLY